MFNLESFSDIMSHIYEISKVVHKHSSGWYSVFCPYCNDASRRPNPNHGHFYIAPDFPFCLCFRCGVRTSIHKFLIDTGFENVQTLNKIKSTGFTYSQGSKIYVQKKDPNLFYKLLNQYGYFYNNYPNEFVNFKQYLYERFGDINPIDFNIVPTLNQYSTLGIQFFNFYGQLVTTRLTKGKKRYITHGSFKYFFQNLEEIDEYENIVISEGPIDIINVYKYLIKDKTNYFYLSASGIHINSLISNIVQNFLLIGYYNVIIILDKGMFDKTLKQIQYTTNKLNPNISIYFYEPVKSKDVSELMYLNPR